MENIIECKECGKMFSKYGIKNHIEFKHNNRKNVRSGKKPWNYGLTKENNMSVLNSSKKISKALKGKNGHKHTEETKKKISEAR